ncbi:DUF1285 domain-containing protein [Tropicimonas sp. IMCC34011]|uniref:DUF1285 domain-containing protein n=1 Tax=Tropicimonas sp. IMCC34011 TaxID=2248759 RepID=UPI000E239E12|nr:DUF1285 domain-containing protein [Tropicimonas sp. IMCC34011]
MPKAKSSHSDVRTGNTAASAESLAEAARAASGSGKGPPLEAWDPPFCGDLDMEIRRDGTWFYEGTPIGRKALVKLFSTILWREGDAYFLKSPVEKVGIRVEDAPFVAEDAEIEGDGAEQMIRFTTQVGDAVTAGPDHPIRVERDAATGEPSPYVLIRRNLEALVDRKTFYRLVDAGTREEVEGTLWFGLRSGGTFFPIILASELPDG